jgi:hypothetical protein
MKNWAKVEDGIVVNIAVGYENPGGYVEYSPTGEFRKNYAVIGGLYDSNKDIFIQPQPYASWVLDSNDDWQAPTPKPEREGYYYIWNEESTSWEEYESIILDIP